MRRPDLKLAGRVGVGLVLLLAGALKGRYLGESDTPDLDLLSSRAFWDGVICLELAIGLWLVSNVHARQATAFAMVCFVVYFQFSLYFAAVGQSTCPCFGKIDVSPRLTAVLDFVAFFALLNCIPKREESAATWHSHPQRTVAIAVLVSVLGLSSVATAHRYRPEGIDYTLRRDFHLDARARLDSASASQEVVLESLSRAAGGLPFDLDPALGDKGRVLGEFHLSAVQAWTLMEWLAGEQPRAAEWVRAGRGFLLRRVPGWKRIPPAAVAGVDVLAIALAVWCGAREARRLRQKGDC